jgi:CheY-like chemotaxis protein
MAKILVVDDDVDVRTLIEVRLRRIGHRVVSAASGEDALAVVADKGAAELLVLDVLMPGISGLELLATLREDPAFDGVPVIFLSGRVLEGDIAAGRALGATYLTKPVVLTALAAAVETALQPEAALASGTW